MLKQKHSRQSWWPVYVLAFVMAGFLFLAHRLAPSPGWRISLDIGIVLGGYSLIMFWLETSSTPLVDRSAVETDDRSVKMPEVEVIPFPLSTHVQCHFYVGSVPAIDYRLSDGLTLSQRLNGHYPARTMPALPEDAAHPFTNN
ncbi:MAG: hypothetical protein HS126_04505 [Anaerolineales bacterium]|nr:hypothetical protein [Anaerolineales bacterium]